MTFRHRCNISPRILDLDSDDFEEAESANATIMCEPSSWTVVEKGKSRLYAAIRSGGGGEKHGPNSAQPRVASNNPGGVAFWVASLLIRTTSMTPTALTDLMILTNLLILTFSKEYQYVTEHIAGFRPGTLPRHRNEICQILTVPASQGGDTRLVTTTLIDDKGPV